MILGNSNQDDCKLLKDDLLDMYGSTMVGDKYGSSMVVDKLGHNAQIIRDDKRNKSRIWKDTAQY